MVGANLSTFGGGRVPSVVPTMRKSFATSLTRFVSLVVRRLRNTDGFVKPFFRSTRP